MAAAITPTRPAHPVWSHASQSTCEEARSEALVLHRSLAAMNDRVRWWRIGRFVQRVNVDAATYAEALRVLADAWDRGFFPRFRRVLSFVAGVQLPSHDLAAHLAGIAAWHACEHNLPRSVRFEITEEGRRALVAKEGE